MPANVTPTVPDKTPGGYTSAGSLQTLFDAVTDRLKEHELITAKGIRVLPEFAGDLYHQLNQMLNAKLSALMVVGLETVNSKATGLTKSWKDIGIQVACFESVTINQSGSGSKTSALTLAELACGWLHGWLPEGGSPIWMREEETLSLDSERSKPAAGLICYKARFFTQGCPRYDFS